AARGSAAPPADLLLLNGKVFTADPAHPWAQAIAIRGERIVAVGERAAVEREAGRGVRRLDLGGRVVIPGINDAHAHVGPELPGTPIARIGEESWNPPGGFYGHLTGTRTLSGALHEYALWRLTRRLRSEVPAEQAVRDLHAFEQQALRFGITSVQDMSNGLRRDAFVRLLA